MELVGNFLAHVDEVFPVVAGVGNGEPGFPVDSSDLGGVFCGVEIFGNVAVTGVFGRGWTGGGRVASGVGTGFCHGPKGSEGS